MVDKKVYYERDGVRRTVLFDADRSGFVTKTDIDVTKLVENNAAMEELHPRHSTNKVLARIPMSIWERSYHENWDDNDWKRWLNDPENKAFRVWKGRV